GIPVGPGEISLLAWIGWMMFRLLLRPELRLTIPLTRLLVFWGVFAASQCIGFLTGLALDDTRDWSLFLHDVLAYLLAGGFSCLCVADSNHEIRLRSAARCMVSLAAPIVLLQLAAAQGWIDLP